MSFYWFPGSVVFPRTSDEDMKRYGWSPGPWDTEPDRIYFFDADTGYDCAISRNSEIGNLCGYVGVPEEHPLFGKKSDDIQDNCDIVIHGGVGYADSSVDDEARPIPTHSREVWWIGFACNELRDLTPRDSINLPGRVRTYKNIKFVRLQIQCLAVQLKELE